MKRTSTFVEVAVNYYKHITVMECKLTIINSRSPENNIFLKKKKLRMNYIAVCTALNPMFHSDSMFHMRVLHLKFTHG